MKKKLLCILLSLCMLIPSFSGMSAYATGVEEIATNPNDPADPMSQVPAENAHEKIHFYFDTAEHADLESVSELATATASVKTDYATALGVAQRRGTDSAVNENVYITVQFVSDYMEDETYKTLKAARENAKTADERDEAKTNLNQYSKQYHANLVAENLPTLSAIPYTDTHAIDYSSFVTLTVPAAELDTAVLEEVADQDNILHISLTDGFEVVSDSGTYTETNSSKTGWQDVLECINATEVLQETDSSGKKLHTGERIKVGIYESKAAQLTGVSHNRCVVQNQYLVVLGDRLHFRDSSNEYAASSSYTTHATLVTTILAMMLPDAEFYFTHVPEQTGGYLEGISWFITQGCDVVNCSFGVPYGGTYRHDLDALYDYQINNHDIVVVKSSGNADSSDGYITSPGLAHNVITVGGVGYSSTEGGWVHHSNAMYDEANTVIKPNVAVPYTITVPNVSYEHNGTTWQMVSYTASGTSFAAPLVSACAALYLEYFYENIAGSVPQHITRSVIMASANPTKDYQQMSAYISTDDAVGAGIPDLAKILSRSISISLPVAPGGSAGEVARYSMSMNSNETLTVALSWYVSAMPMQYGYPTGGSITTPDFDIHIYDLNGNSVASSTLSNTSTEFVRYTANAAGTYRIVIKKYASHSLERQLSIAFNKSGG